MRPQHLSLLRCPKTGAALELVDAVMDNDRVRSGRLVPAGSAEAGYPIVDFIPRFVSSENYARNFGFEWNQHAQTQYDSVSGHSLSEDRLFRFSSWPRQMAGKLILEAGSGAGRFTEALLATGAAVVSFDYSDAVEANYKSHGHDPNLLLVQADIYAMPFAPDTFDRALCFGVLQHCPDPRKAFHSLVPVLKPGGHLATDIYLKSFTHWLINTRYWVRPLTRTMDPTKLYDRCKAYIDFMWPLARVLRRAYVGEYLLGRLLVPDTWRTVPNASDETQKEWAYLEIFDILSPRYDLPQTPKTYRRWHEECGLKEINVRLGSNGVVGTAKRP